MNRSIKKSTRRARLIRIWICLMALFLGELLLYTWCRVQCVRVGYAISAQHNIQQRLLMRRNRLKIELAHLKSPERIESIARRKMGLTAPRPEQVIILP
jgi:cell division protein FtsB